MPPTATRSDGELAASVELRVLTNEAADLINAAFPDRKGPSRAFLVASSLRRYVVQRPVPFVVTKEGEIGVRVVYLRRLTVRDLTRSLPGVTPRRLGVLDNSAFHHEGLEVVARTGATAGASSSFFHARTEHLMRFWIDVRNELGRELGSRLTPRDFARLRELGDQAGIASAASLREQRKALGMSQRKFARAIGIPVAGIIRVENGEIDLTLPLLDRFLSAFGDLKRTRKQAGPAIGARESKGSPQPTPDVEASSNGQPATGARLRRVRMEKPTQPARGRANGGSRPKGQRTAADQTPGGKIRERRRTARISQETLSKEVGITVPDLSNLERNKEELTPAMRNRIIRGIRRIEATRPRIVM